MATARPFGRNTGSPISGTLSYGNIAVGTGNHPYTENYGGIRWFNGADEELGYVIGVEVPTSDWPTPSGNIGTVKFYRTSAFTDNDFIYLSNRVTGQSFTGGTQAYSWLINNGYWTSYTANTEIYYTILSGNMIVQTYVPTSDKIFSSRFSSGELVVYSGENFTGNTTMSVSPGGVSDSIGELAYGANIDRVFGTYINYGKLQMYNPSNNTTVTTLAVGNDGNDRRSMAYNEDDSTVWMISPDYNTVYVVSATTTTLTSITGVTLSFSSAPRTIAWNSSRNLMYIGGNREIDVVDCDTKEIITELNNVGDTNYVIPENGFAYDSINDRVYFIMMATTFSTLKVYYIDCSTDTVSSVLHTESGIASSTNVCIEYDPNGFVWIGSSGKLLVLKTSDNNVKSSDSLTGLATDIVFKPTKNQMICARGSTNNAVVYDVTSVYYS